MAMVDVVDNGHGCGVMDDAGGQGRRVSRLAPDVHIFGHTHFGWDMNVAGTRYIQNPWGYPQERTHRSARACACLCVCLRGYDVCVCV